MTHQAGDSGFVAWANGVDDSIDAIEAAAAAEAAARVSGDADAVTSAVAQAATNGNATYLSLAAAASGYQALGNEPPRLDLPPRFLPSSIISAFQSGHGWTNNGSGTVTLNDTAAGGFIVGSQALKMVTAGNGSNTQVKKTGMTSFDMTGKCFAITLKVDDNTHLASLYVLFGDTALANRYDIAVQGSVSTANQEIIEPGKWVRIVVPWRASGTTGTPNRAAITDMQVRVTDDNTGNPVTVHLQRIEIIPEPATQFPNGVISFDFDDGMVEHLTVAARKLSQYGWAGTAYPVVDVIDTTGFWMTTANLRELQDVHGWDVAVHAATMANHNARWTSLTSAQVAEEMRASRAWLAANGFRGVDLHAYPGGQWNDAVLTEARKKFAFARTVTARTKESWPPSEPLKVRALTVSTALYPSVATLQAEVDAAIAGRYWLIFVFHGLTTTGAGTSEFKIADFNTLVDYVATKNIPVRTPSRVLATR